MWVVLVWAGMCWGGLARWPGVQRAEEVIDPPTGCLIMSAAGTTKLNNEKQASVCVYCSFSKFSRSLWLAGLSAWLPVVVVVAAGRVSDLSHPADVCLPITQER